MSNPEPEPGKCNAETRDGGYCANHPVKGRDRCRMHGGNNPVGKDHHNFKHGLFSDYLSEEDREVIELLEEYEDADKLDEIINWRLARLRRAVKALNDDEEQNFWDAFETIVNETDEIGADEISELASMLDRGNRAMQEEIDVIRKLIKDRNKIAEGEDINMGWREMLAGGDG